jgi:hypothetical protein
MRSGALLLILIFDVWKANEADCQKDLLRIGVAVPEALYEWIVYGIAASSRDETSCFVGFRGMGLVLKPHEDSYRRWIGAIA